MGTGVKDIPVMSLYAVIATITLLSCKHEIRSTAVHSYGKEKKRETSVWLETISSKSSAS